MNRSRIFVAAAAASIAAMVAPQAAMAGTTLNGGGSSFVANLMEKCQALYNADSSVNKNSDTVTYTATGSGTGRTNFANKLVKWAASDSTYSTGAPSGFVYAPLVAGAIAMAYKLDGVTPAGSTVRLSPETIAKIFSGQVKTWNDPVIVADNKASVTPGNLKASLGGVTATVAKKGAKATITVTMTAGARTKYKGKTVSVTRTTAAGKTSKAGTALAIKPRLVQTLTHTTGDIYTVKVGNAAVAAIGPDPIVVGTTVGLPATPIKVAYRSDGSGTSNNFTRYLNATSPGIWTKPANDSFTSAFPGSVPADGTFQAAKGSDGVSNYVKDNNGSITYVELSYATERASSGVKAAAVKNNAGVYVVPTAASSAAFYANASVDDSGVVTPDYLVVSADVYTINAIAYALAYTANSSDNQAVRAYLSFVLGTCSPNNGAGLGYAPLTGELLTKAQAQVAKIGA